MVRPIFWHLFIRLAEQVWQSSLASALLNSKQIYHPHFRFQGALDRVCSAAFRSVEVAHQNVAVVCQIVVAPVEALRVVRRADRYDAVATRQHFVIPLPRFVIETRGLRGKWDNCRQPHVRKIATQLDHRLARQQVESLGHSAKEMAVALVIEHRDGLPQSLADGRRSAVFGIGKKIAVGGRGFECAVAAECHRECFSDFHKANIIKFSRPAPERRRRTPKEY